MNEQSMNAAVIFTIYKIAAHIYAMLAERRMTAPELCGSLIAISAEWNNETKQKAVAALLRGEGNGGNLTCRDLSDIAFALGFEWKFSVSKKEPFDDGRSS